MAMSRVQNVPVTKTMTIRIRTVMFYEVTNDNHDAVFDVLAHPIGRAFGLNLFLSKWNKVQIMNMYERL